MAQIESQIDVLNEDFRRLNADAPNTPVAFQPVASDVGIEFYLACIDPNGNQTNGVVRKQGQSSYTVVESGNEINESATGIKLGVSGSLAWPTDQYLNIWVCNLAGGLLGYAQFPADYITKPNTDGVVITTTAFGRTGNVIPPFDLGRTASHEVGHWLNLRHIWGDGAGCNSPTAPVNCACHLDDGVADTPNQGRANYGCPSHPHATCSSNDMFMNYMDYTNDGCMNIFTVGQRSRMRSLFTTGGVRSSFIESPMGLSITGPSTLCTSETYTISNLPTGVTVTGWSASPSGAVTLSGSGNSRTVTRAGSYNGQVTLTVEIGTDCGTVEIEKETYVGVRPITGSFYRPNLTEVPFGTGGLFETCNGTSRIEAYAEEAGSTFLWQKLSGNGSFSVLPGGNAIDLVMGANQSGFFRLTVTNSCGSRIYNFTVSTIDYDCFGFGLLAVYPNPANETLTVSLGNHGHGSAEKRMAPTTTFTAILYDGSGREQRRGESRDGTIQFDTAGLPEGTYFVHIHKDGEVEKRQVVIRH